MNVSRTRCSDFNADSNARSARCSAQQGARPAPHASKSGLGLALGIALELLVKLPRRVLLATVLLLELGSQLAGEAPAADSREGLGFWRMAGTVLLPRRTCFG